MLLNRLISIFYYLLLVVTSRWSAYLIFFKKIRLNINNILLLSTGLILGAHHLIISHYTYGFVFLKFILIPICIPNFGLLYEKREYFYKSVIVLIVAATMIFGFRGADQLGYGINSIYLGALLAMGLYDTMNEGKKLFSLVILITILLNGSGTSLVMLIIVFALRGGLKSIPFLILLLPIAILIIGTRGRSLSSIQDWDRVILSVSYIQSLFTANPLGLFFSGLGQAGLDAWSIKLKSTLLYDYVLAENGSIRENMLHNDFLRMINSFGLIWTMFYWFTLYRELGKKALILFTGSLVNPLLTVNLVIFSLLFIKKR